MFPAAISGIVASLILAFSRAIGETMVVSMAAGAVGGSLFAVNVLDPGQTMTAAMASLAIGSDQVAGEGLAFQSLFFLGLLLFLMTLVAQLRERSLRAPGAGEVLMATRTERHQRATRDVVAGIARREADRTWRRHLQGVLLLMLLSSLLILVVPACGRPRRGWANACATRLGFVTVRLSLSPETAGVWTEHRRLGGHRIPGDLLAIPIGIGAAVYLEEYAPDNRLTGWINTTSATWPVCRRSSTASSA